MSRVETYESHATITSIRATSRASVKIGDNFYTVEYCEERSIPDIEGVSIEDERRLLWDTANNEVDSQIEDIINMFKKKQK